MSFEFENNFDEKLNKINSALINAAKEIGITEVASIQANTPVLKGNLKRSFTYEVENKQKGNVKIDIGSSIEYAPIVEFKPSKVQGFMRNTLNRDKRSIENIFNDHLKGV